MKLNQTDQEKLIYILEDSLQSDRPLLLRWNRYNLEQNWINGIITQIKEDNPNNL